MASVFPPSTATVHTEPNRREQLRRSVEHAAHLLPSQGPITVFVHHNTLHPFEDLPFDQAVVEGLRHYGCQPYLAEEVYRAKLAEGRIRPDDIAAVLLSDLGDEADRLVGFMGTRYHLRMAMLEHPLRLGTADELRWLIAETDTLFRFRPEVPPEVRSRMVGTTRDLVVRTLGATPPTEERGWRQTIESVLSRFEGRDTPAWPETTWEAFTLHLLWQVCHQGVHGIPRFAEPAPKSLRHRDLLKQASGADADALVHDLLIRFCGAFLDQGFAHWPLPDRDLGFYKSFISLYRRSRPAARWMRKLPAELRRIADAGLGPLESLEESLELLGVTEAEQEEYLTQTLLALRGWAGMIWQMETNAEWTVRPAPRGSLLEFAAIRLILDRLAVEHLAQTELGVRVGLAELRSELRRRIPHPPRVNVDQRAYLVFQLAQVRGWSPAELHRLSKEDWRRLLAEIEAFSSLERRRIYHHAYERRYHTRALDALEIHCRRHANAGVRPAGGKSFQLVTCIDDREESFRRHLEEVDPRCETFAAAGFYAIAMYYRGATEAHFRPLCPVVIKPRHYVRESAAYSLTASSRQRAETRRVLGTAVHRWHVQSRTFAGGILTALLGSLASVPMVTGILLPRLASRLRDFSRRLVAAPAVTELTLLRSAETPGPEPDELGYTLDEMAGIVERILRDLGLTRDFARIVLFLGHGSSSLNNPHESAYNCGACSGGRGGPNARAFAQMANHPEVRRRLQARGLTIPESTIFVGGFHNTCDEDVIFFDLDRIPVSHRKEFEAARDVIDEARARNAHERCRRFESVSLDLTPAEALEHVQVRAEDLSQARPEYNHATNALTIVGRRARTRGLFLDRRAFLNCYDPTQDDAEHSILERILQAAIPVCAGISLEYYFSTVDPVGYGCGSKLPHNIVSLLGVMEGAASDLRPGLSQQMIEIHEPLRNLMIIETTPEAMDRILERNPGIARLVRNEWVRLALLDPHSPALLVYQNGGYEPYRAESNDLPVCESSLAWYRGQRDHLWFAAIEPRAAAETADGKATKPEEAATAAQEGL